MKVELSKDQIDHMRGILSQHIINLHNEADRAHEDKDAPRETFYRDRLYASVALRDYLEAQFVEPEDDEDGDNEEDPDDEDDPEDHAWKDAE